MAIKPASQPKLAIPPHVAIIMDGNGRWAKKRFMPTLIGHSEGRKALRRTVENSIDIGIKYLTVYAFSTENWKRSPDEIDGLFKLLKAAIYEEFTDLYNNGVKVRFIGNIAALNKDVQKDIEYIETKTADRTKLTLQVCLNYGGRDEIVRAAAQLAQDNIEITEENLSKAIMGDIPEPDLLIRTGGDYRVSNFLLWQIAYTEIAITHVLWPDFDKEALLDCIKDYNKRVRRFGGRYE